MCTYFYNMTRDSIQFYYKAFRNNIFYVFEDVKYNAVHK